MDKGSLFWLEIPFGRVCISNISVQTEKNDIRTIHTGNLNGLKVLAVDDKAINLTIVKRALMQEGANVTLAADGKQALDILQTNPNEFDIVLMDVEMPVMDGLQATREIRLNDSLSHIPVIIVSAGVLSEERSAALKAGADDFLAKPINLMELKSVLGRYTTPEKEYEAS